MKQKEAIIITAFFNYDYPIRIKYLESYLSSINYNVTIVSADYDHRNKIEYKSNKDNLVLIHVPPYKKNLSLKRIASHYAFAKGTKAFIKTKKPDLVYCITPPNLLIKNLSPLKRKGIIKELVYEVEDLWPETLPLKNSLKRLASPLLWMWARIRNNSIRYADRLVFECDLFKTFIVKKNPSLEEKSNTIYLSKENCIFGNDHGITKNYTSINFLYLGSINNLIDINLIANLLEKTSNIIPCSLTIIGGGENASLLIEKCEKNNIHVDNYGIVFDEKKKQNIIEGCDFALNIMNEYVFVGATMKSLEYFHYGLPIINNIGGDTAKIVEEYCCGINIENRNLDKSVFSIVNIYKQGVYEKFSNGSRLAYMTFFEPSVFYKKIKAIIK